MELEITTECDCSKKDFSKRGCWYCRQKPSGGGYNCVNPCVNRLKIENDQLRIRITQLEQKLQELRSEV